MMWGKTPTPIRNHWRVRLLVSASEVCGLIQLDNKETLQVALSAPSVEGVFLLRR